LIRPLFIVWNHLKPLEQFTVCTETVFWTLNCLVPSEVQKKFFVHVMEMIIQNQTDILLSEYSRHKLQSVFWGETQTQSRQTYITSCKKGHNMSHLNKMVTLYFDGTL